MPAVLPFTGLRYVAAAGELARLICPPYDVISPDEQSALERESPFNAVRLELPRDPAPGQGDRYASAAKALEEWRGAGVLRRDGRPAYYLHSTEYSHAGNRLRRRDVLAAVAVEPWSARVALPHEHTMAGPKQDRYDLLSATHLNTSPIWLLYRHRQPAVDEAWARSQDVEPLASFSWRDEHHQLWSIEDPAEVLAIQAAFDAGGPLYIADGHHRYETSLAFKNQAGARLPGAGATLATLTHARDPGLAVLPTHRILRDLDASLTLEEAETRWSDVFHLEYYPVWDHAPADQIDALMQQLASSGRAGPSFGVYGLHHLDLFGLLELRGRKVPDSALPADRSAAWKSLDVALLHALLIDPLVIETGRKREEVLSYTRDAHQAIAEVRSGRASVAFFLNPTPVQSVLEVADAGDLMPEKSTYFYPKPPAGLVMRDLDLSQ
jgi:uncharacterized protein (DUF1015 family)